jgi:hypothetical protein
VVHLFRDVYFEGNQELYQWVTAGSSFIFFAGYGGISAYAAAGAQGLSTVTLGSALLNSTARTSAQILGGVVGGAIGAEIDSHVGDGTGQTFTLVKYFIWS